MQPERRTPHELEIQVVAAMIFLSKTRQINLSLHKNFTVLQVILTLID